MERTPNQRGESQDTHLHVVPSYDEQHEQHQESHDERVIREGIERALREGTEIDDRTARYIASQLHEGQDTALSSFIALLGAEINSEIEHQTAIDSTVGPAHPMGQRGAVVADTLGRGADNSKQSSE